MDIKIYYDEEQEVEWFVSLDTRLCSAERILLRDRGQNNNEIIEDLILYDRPDIILLINDIPKLVLEKTEEVPSGHNVGQRIGRLARAVELGVPIVKFFPFLAMKHGDYASRCFVRPNIFMTFKKMKEFHKVHALAIDWICDDHDFELIRDGTENIMLQRLIKSFIDNNYSFNNTKEAKYIERLMDGEYNTRINSNIHYRRLVPSLSIVNTKRLVLELQSKFDNLGLQKQISERNETLVYTIYMTSQNCRREDPYTGTQFIYDYCYCRNGPEISDRTKNFIFRFPLITKNRWKEANPLDRTRKSYLWYVLADFMIFKDGVLKRGDNFEQ